MQKLIAPTKNSNVIFLQKKEEIEIQDSKKITMQNSVEIKKTVAICNTKPKDKFDISLWEADFFMVIIILN
jgi:hypothetical protein